jgi:hypothetical protein
MSIRKDSSAPCSHSFFFQGTGWCAQILVFLAEYGHDLDSPLQPRRFVVRTLISPTPARIFFIYTKKISNLRSYMNLIVLALATSTFSPALSAPIPYRYGNLFGFKGWAFDARDPKVDPDLAVLDSRGVGSPSVQFVHPNGNLVKPGSVLEQKAHSYPPASASTPAPSSTASKNSRCAKIIGAAIFLCLAGAAIALVATHHNHKAHNNLEVSS